MKLATACSGIGAPEEAARALGRTSTWCAEVAPFPFRQLHGGAGAAMDFQAASASA